VVFYRLPKEKLVEIAAAYSVDNTGTLDEVRRRMSGYIDEHPEEFASEREESSGAFAPPLISINTPVPNEETAFPMPEPLGDDLRVLNQMRKWGCHFDGRDPASFLERLTELQESYRVPGAQLLRGLPELLRGDALLWYRNFHAR